MSTSRQDALPHGHSCLEHSPCEATSTGLGGHACCVLIAGAHIQRPVSGSETKRGQGAWIGKPTAANSKRRRFFQLSEDGSTLRWAWNKYIIMYYVEVCPASEHG